MIRISNTEEKIYQNTKLQIIFSVTLMSVLAVSSVSPIFPEVQKYFNVSPEEVGLLVTLFTLPGIFFTPFFGILADRFGRKAVLIPSLLLFGIAGGTMGLTFNFTLLLILRFLQGVGGASLGSLNITLIGDIFSDVSKRSTAMGYNASVLSVGTAFYPFIGGSLGILGWNYPFLLPFVAIPVGIITLFWFKEPEITRNRSAADYFKKIFQGLRDKRILWIFFISMMTFTFFYGSYLTYFPFFMSHSFKINTFIIGIFLSSMSISVAITSSQFGKLSSKMSQQFMIKIAFALYGLSLFIIPLIHDVWFLFLATTLFGFAQGMNIPSIQLLLVRFSPPQQRAAFMSLNGMSLRLGQTIGPLIMGIFFSTLGITWVFWAGAALAVGFSIAFSVFGF